MTSSSPSQHDNWRLGDQLTQIEDEMLSAAATGGLLDRAQGPFDPAAMENWGQDRTVRASVLRYLLVVEDWPVHAKGVRLGGVRISATSILNRQRCAVRCALSAATSPDLRRSISITPAHRCLSSPTVTCRG